jgi:23S rRNA (cytosine1962-C5)-methyltransferase
MSETPVRTIANARRQTLSPVVCFVSTMNDPAAKKFLDPALLDFGCDETGHGRRLEHFGGVLIDRPLPASRAARQQPGLWQDASVVFREASRGRGSWDICGHVPDPWLIDLPLPGHCLRLLVRPAPSGQVGIFLEQWPQWQWLTRATSAGSRVLSLFAHSGAATLALAAAGAEVVHIDSSRQALELARENAAASGLAAAPIRWVREDARRFVNRELRRGSQYDGLVLDPPSWGHGPKGEAFAIDRDLPRLLADCCRLLTPAARGPVLLSAHSPGWQPKRLQATLTASLETTPLAATQVSSGELTCPDLAGRLLPQGGFARAGGLPPSATCETNS